jgi:hypothetical protein
LRKNSAKLKRDPAGKEVMEKTEEFVTQVHGNSWPARTFGREIA